MAFAPGRAPQVLTRIAGKLGEIFGVAVDESALATGACVLESGTLAKAELRAPAVTSTGADFQIIGPDGDLYGEGTARNMDATLAGTGAWAPPAEIGNITIAAPSSAVEALNVSASGKVRDDSSLEFLNEASPPPVAKKKSDGLDLDSLDASALVTLDGEEDVAPEPETLAIKPPPPTPATPQPTASIDPYGSGDDAPLELDDYQPVSSPPDPALMNDEPLELGTPLPPPTPPSDTSPGYAAARSQSAELPAVPGSFAAAERERRNSSAGFPAVRPRTETGGRRAAKRLPDGFLLFGGKLRQAWPRVRILVGFLVPLMLGAIVPMCHASSVMSSKVAPERKELARAKAYGHLLSTKPGYRAPEVIEANISSIKTRSGIYTFLIWLFFAGGMGVAWFRFT